MGATSGGCLASSLMRCTVCGGSAVETDTASGCSFCVSCGNVMEENTIVSELSFGETDSGQAVLHGQFVSDKGIVGIPFSAGSVPRRLNATESREVTLANARRRIQQLATAVTLSEQYVDMAHRWFILALQHNFTRGRKAVAVAAACLYIVCRLEKTSHMLLDFSEILRMNVFLLGAVFLKLVRVLNLDLPLVDPSLYMARFAARLEFGDRTQAVAATALRIAARMKRDWIQTGRRPSGICGACLIVAGRLFGFQRTQLEVIQVVKVCEATIRKRMQEFASLPSGRLTPAEFHSVWLEEEADPPVFAAAKFSSVAMQKIAAAKSAAKTPKRKMHTVDTFSPPSEDDDEAADEVTESQLEKLLLSAEMKDAVNSVKVDLEQSLATELSGGNSLQYLDDDFEVATCIVPEEERNLRDKIWQHMNAQFLAEQKAQSDHVNDSEADAQKLKVRKTRGSRKRNPEAVPENAAVAAQSVVDVKRISKKINYDIFEDLINAEKPVVA